MYDIYKITNRANGKIYVGLTSWGYQERWLRHKSAARSGIETYLYNAIRLYGEDTFDVELIEILETREQAKEREKFWIQELKATDRNIGYNIKEGGEGEELPEETKRKISETHKQRFLDNPELREIYGAKKRGIKYPPEYGQKISAAKKSKNLVLSEETKKRIGEGVKAANLNKPTQVISEGQKKILREAAKAQFSSEESRRKHSEIMKAHYAAKKLETQAVTPA